MSKEFRHYALRSSTRPSKPGALLTTVQVIEAGAVGYAYVNFSDKLVEAVGKKLPRGISLEDPAYLSVESRDSMWEVWALYVRGGVPELMWRQATRPEWLNFHEPRKARNGDNFAEEATSTGRISGRDPATSNTSKGDTNPG